MDVDVYWDNGGKLDVYGMRVDIEIILERMKHKDPNKVKFETTDQAMIDVKHRYNVTLKAEKNSVDPTVLPILLPQST